jgi:hypothetical protein
MAISNLDIRLLWARAGGRCSKPDCTEDLTVLLETGNYDVGEMAHVIGRKPNAARGTSEGGSDTYNNLVLLCPTHHTHIDKAPEGTFPIEMLHEWKRTQENIISNAGKTKRFETFDQLHSAISRILASNNATFETFGPKSATAKADPSSNLFSVWELRRLDRIVPNNLLILNLIDGNEALIPSSAIPAIEKFRVHADAYQQHVIYTLDSYPLFPSEFAEIFS